MKKITLFLSVLIFSNVLYSKDFPLSSKGYSGTVIEIKNIDTDRAFSIGEVTKENAKEYCERDPGGETIEFGGKLTFQQCVDNILKQEKNKKLSATADCIRKKVTIELGGTYILKNKSWNNGSWNYTWVDDESGEILDGSLASGESIVEQTFRMLCPAFIK